MDRNIIYLLTASAFLMSLSARRAWIEMSISALWMVLSRPVALRKESVDRNTKDVSLIYNNRWSLSARRAWIEISISYYKEYTLSVALRKESVDRNIIFNTCRAEPIHVALRKESVDRNCIGQPIINQIAFVALRKESVDRNEYIQAGTGILNCRSPQGERG